MAIYHLSTKVFSRSKGQSATGAAAYRSGGVVPDVNTGEIHDYSRKTQVDFTHIYPPKGTPDNSIFLDRAHLWNAVEQGEKRKDSQLCREYEMALPCEISNESKLKLVEQFANELAEKGMFVDVAIHKIDSDNPHVHMLCTMREFDVNTQTFGKKEREWNSKQNLESIRERWGQMLNAAVEKESPNQAQRLDHRSFERQRLDSAPLALETESQYQNRMLNVQRVPTIHRGKTIEHGTNTHKLDRYQQILKIQHLNEIIEKIIKSAKEFFARTAHKPEQQVMSPEQAHFLISERAKKRLQQTKQQVQTPHARTAPEPEQQVTSPEQAHFLISERAKKRLQQTKQQIKQTELHHEKPTKQQVQTPQEDTKKKAPKHTINRDLWDSSPSR